MSDSYTLPTEKSSPIPPLGNMSFLLYGEPKVGKTTFISSLDDILIVDTQKGAKFQEAYRKEVGSWQEFKDLVSNLKKAKPGSLPYDMVAIDILGDVSDWCQEYVGRKIGFTHASDLDWGKGWSLVKKEWMSVMSVLKNCGLGVWFVCHSQTREMKRGLTKYDYTAPDLPGFLSKTIVQDVDMVIYAYVEQVGKKEGNKTFMEENRVLRCQPSKNICAGGRISSFPKLIALDVDEFKNCLESK